MTYRSPGHASGTWRRWHPAHLRFKAREVAETVLGKLPKPRYAIIFRLKTPTAACSIRGLRYVPWPELVHRRRCAGTAGSWRPVILDLLLKRILTIPGLRIVALVSFPNARFLTINST